MITPTACWRTAPAPTAPVHSLCPATVPPTDQIESAACCITTVAVLLLQYHLVQLHITVAGVLACCYSIAAVRAAAVAYPVVCLCPPILQYLTTLVHIILIPLA